VQLLCEFSAISNALFVGSEMRQACEWITNRSCRAATALIFIMSAAMVGLEKRRERRTLSKNVPAAPEENIMTEKVVPDAMA